MTRAIATVDIDVKSVADTALKAAARFWLRARDRAGAPARIAVAVGLCLLTVVMGIGIFAAAMGMWLPRL